MQSTTITKITTGTLAALLAGSIGYGIHQTNQADTARRSAGAWQQEASGWQATAATTQTANEQLARRYNNLVVEVKQASANDSSTALAQVAAVAPVATVVQNPAPVAPAAQAAPAQAPTSQAS